MNSSDDKVVIIYQMGKVASSTITQTINELPGFKAYKAHRLFPENIDELDEYLKKCGDNNEDVRKWKDLYYKYINSNMPVKIITLTREPISRNISAFFENYKYYVGSEINDENSVDEIIKIFKDKYPHRVPLTWFENEFNKALNIDIFNYPFSKQLGYLIIKNKNVDIMVMKSEMEDSKKEHILSEFLKIDYVKLIPRNIGSKKKYNKLYYDFLDKINIDKDYVNLMYNSQYTKHFYNKNDIDEYINKWLR